jgi:exodeoxyribonuclease V alpha subunit
VVVLSQSHYVMLQRNLLYTALTRSRQRGHHHQRRTGEQTGRIFKTVLEVAVGNDRIARRYSGLAERLTSSIAHLHPAARAG